MFSRGECGGKLSIIKRNGDCETTKEEKRHDGVFFGWSKDFTWAGEFLLIGKLHEKSRRDCGTERIRSARQERFSKGGKLKDRRRVREESRQTFVRRSTSKDVEQKCIDLK